MKCERYIERPHVVVEFLLVLLGQGGEDAVVRESGPEALVQQHREWVTGAIHNSLDVTNRNHSQAW